MKFDLTTNIKLDEKWQKRYVILRFLLLVVFIFSGIYFAYLTLFPSQMFTLDFSDINAKANTLLYESGEKNENLIDAYSRESFSRANFQLTLKKTASAISNQTLSFRKIYKAFAFPTSEKPASFPEGSLLKNNGHYFIVSDGKLRQFSSEQLIRNFGYNPDSFSNTTEEELSFSEKGDIINDTVNYPDSVLFLINENYYQLQNKILYPFVSENAFISHFSRNQAITKDTNFLSDKTVDHDNPIGFANGTMLSFDVGVFLVVDGKVMPFADPLTFVSLGYSWNDVIPANEAEIGLYKRDKLFTVEQPHPNGTLFFAKDTDKYYLIENGTKQEIRGANMLKSYLKTSPIMVEEKSLDFENSCQLSKNIWPLHSYSCTLSLKNLENSTGNDFEFKLANLPKSSLAQVDITLSKEINWLNMRDILSIIKQKLFANYGYGQPTQ